MDTVRIIDILKHMGVPPEEAEALVKNDLEDIIANLLMIRYWDTAAQRKVKERFPNQNRSDS